MAICLYCKREMLKAPSCTVAVMHRNGEAVAMIPYGSEGRFGRQPRHEHCHDCGAGWGQLHHLGCDVQECPNCGDQMMCCGCRYDEDPPEPDDDDDDPEVIGRGWLMIPSPN